MIDKEYNFQDVILGLIIRDGRHYDQAVSLGMSEVHFTGERRTIWETAVILKNAGLEIDLSTVCLKLPQFLNLILNIYSDAPISLNFDWFCLQLMSINNLKKAAVELSNFSTRIMAMTFDESPEPFFNEASQILGGLRTLQATDKNATRFTTELLDSTLARIESRVMDSREDKFRGIKTGLAKLDNQTSGLVNGRFYIIAARTSVGKTTFASFIALKAAMQQKHALIFSNEMDGEDLVEKFISQRAGIDSKLIQTGNLTEMQLDRVSHAIREINQYKFGINQHYGWKLETLEAEIYRVHALGKCDIVFVDYTQQVQVKKTKTKQEQVSEVATRLKKLSRDLDIPVVGLAQINRDTEKSGKSTLPGLANLKDSGALEQDADVVMILHKEDLTSQNVVLRLAKNRFGDTGLINIRHHVTTNNYTEV